jgi:subtilisin-like proprotein convertase family protein
MNLVWLTEPGRLPAHSNQWFILIRNDDPDVDPNPDPVEPGDTNMNTYSYEGGPITIPDTLDGSAECGGDEVTDFAQADIVIPDGLTIIEFEVNFEIEHFYSTDVYAILEHNGVKVADLWLCSDDIDYIQGIDGELIVFKEKLDFLSGTLAEGTWSLVVGDYYGWDEGTINSFSITVHHGPVG